MHPSASAGVRLSAIVALAALVIFIVCPLGEHFHHVLHRQRE